MNKIWDNAITRARKVPPRSSKREDMLDWIRSIQLVENYTAKLEFTKPDFLEDEIADIWLILCEQPQERWDSLYSQGKSAISAFVSGIIFRSIHSSSSPLYYKYKRVREKEVRLTPKQYDALIETNMVPPTHEEYRQGNLSDTEQIYKDEYEKREAKKD